MGQKSSKDLMVHLQLFHGHAMHSLTWSDSTPEIARSREGAWEHFQSRRHTILKVYTQSEKADDILLLGELTAEFKNGNSATGQFCARIVVGGPETAKPQFRHYEVWAVRCSCRDTIALCCTKECWLTVTGPNTVRERDEGLVAECSCFSEDLHQSK